MALLYLLALASVTVVRGQIPCFQCKDVLRPSDCQLVTTCGAHQICFSDEIVTPDGRTSYDVGCRNKAICDLILGIPGEHTGDRCSKCCTGPYCNQYLCDDVKEDPISLQCYSCHDVADPRSCGILETCPPSTQCYTEFVITDMMRLRYNMGCKKDQGCGLLGFPRKRSETLNKNTHLCQACCKGSFCNREICAPELPTTTAIQTTTPLPTTPAPRVKSFKDHHVTGFPDTDGHLSCFKCSGVSNPASCQLVVKCQPHELCYADEVVSPGGKVTYNVGCREMKSCEQTAIALGTENGRCSQCCAADYCNMDVCGVEAVEPPGLQCFNCKGVDDIRTCGIMTTCLVDTQCYTEYVVTDMMRLRYNMGCKADATCALLASPKARDLIGQREKRLEHLCQACCNANFCNKEICTSALPTTTVPTSSNTSTITPSPSIVSTLNSSALTTSSSASLSTATPSTTSPSPATPSASPSTATAQTASPSSASPSSASPTTESVTLVASTMSTPGGFSCYSCHNIHDPRACNDVEVCRANEDTCYVKTSLIGGAQKYTMGCVKRHHCHNVSHSFELCCGHDRCNKDYISDPVLTCNSCHMTRHTHQCSGHLVCLRGESCFSRVGFHGAGQELHDFGCIPQEDCAPSVSRVPPKTDYSESCFSCCNGPYCNSEPCNFTVTTPQITTQGTTTPPDNRRECLSCIGAEKPEDCQTYTTCPIGEECYYFKQFRGGKLVHDFGCSKPETCANLLSELPDCRLTTSPSHQCITCCDQNNCNRDIKVQRDCVDCLDVSDTSQCRNLTRGCPLGEECYYFREPRNGKITHDFGCATKQHCDQLTTILPDCHEPGNHLKQCISCCIDALCTQEFI